MEDTRSTMQRCTDTVLGSIQTMQNERDTELVRLVYKWRIDKNTEDLMDGLVMRTIDRFKMNPVVAAITIGVADEATIVAQLDKRVLVGGEYLYYGPGKQIVEELAAEAIERNPDKVRCRWCYHEPCICTHQLDELKYDF